METATQWLFEKLWDEPKDKLTWYALLEQAKQMEKEQIIDAFNMGMEEFANDTTIQVYQGEQYYNETFKNK